MSTSPPVGCSRPAMVRSSVILPQPDGPSSTRYSPPLAARLTPSMAWTRPPSKYLLRSRSNTEPAPGIRARRWPASYASPRRSETSYRRISCRSGYTLAGASAATEPCRSTRSSGPRSRRWMSPKRKVPRWRGRAAYRISPSLSGPTSSHVVRRSTSNDTGTVSRSVARMGRPDGLRRRSATGLPTPIESCGSALRVTRTVSGTGVAR